MTKATQFIISDTREQKPFNFSELNQSIEVKQEALETGDYTLDGFETRFAVERKSLDDLAQCVTYSRDRFKRELERGSKMERFAVVIERPRNLVEKYRGRGKLPNNILFSDVHPNSVLGSVDIWSDRYDIEFYWKRNRREAAKWTVEKLEEWADQLR